MERWLPVPGWEGLYEVSDLGKVRSLPRQTRSGVRGGKILKFGTLKGGYRHCTLCRDNKPHCYQVHVLVLLAFEGPCPEGLQIRHLDGNPDNNRLDNLVYGTPKENMEDRDKQHGTNYELNKMHCPQGHPYDDINTYIAPNGWRQCRMCRAYQLEKRNAKRRLDNPQ